MRGGSPTLEFDSTSGGNGRIFTDGADLTINDGTLDSAGNERLRITSSGVLQINETAGGASDGASMNFIFGNNNSTDVISSIIFSNNVGEVARIQGETRNGNTNGMITFHSDISGTSAERMRINHDGAFCFGNDSARPAEFSQPNGFSLRWDDKGQFQNTVTDATGGLMNRKGSDGQILSFRRDGTGVGHIGVNASTMYLNFGSTVSADRQLNHYQTGTWTPEVIDANGSNYSITYTANETRYVRIGNLVYCYYNIRNQEGGSKTGDLRLRGWPFTCKGFQINGAYWVDHSSPSAGLGDIVGGTHYINRVSGNNVIYWVKPTDKSGSGQASTRYLQHGQWTNGRWIYGSFVYEVS